MSNVKYLQQRLDDLRERERLAKLHNRELLQQFDEAQNTLREVLNRTAVMKMLRKEFKSYIGSCSHWNHQLYHKTQTAEENIFGEHQQRNAKTNQLSYSHDQLIPRPTQTETMPKQPPSCLSETTEDYSHSEDLDVKPVRLSSDQAGSKSSSRSSSQSSSDENQFIPHKSLTSREVAIGSEAFISELEDAKTFSNHKLKYINKLGFKDKRNKDNSSESHGEGDKSDVDESSVKLSQEAQESGQLKFPTLKEKNQILSDQSSLEDEDDDSEKDQTETSQEDDREMSNQDIPGSSSVEEANHETMISGSTSSAEESASYKCDGSGNNMNVHKSNQDTALGPEDSDSEDCIVSPQTRSKILYVIPEHVVKHQDEESKGNHTSSDDDNLDSSSDEEDIEHVLAPQEQTRKQRKPKSDDTSKELCDSDDFYD